MAGFFPILATESIIPLEETSETDTSKSVCPPTIIPAFDVLVDVPFSLLNCIVRVNSYNPGSADAEVKTSKVNVSSSPSSN